MRSWIITLIGVVATVSLAERAPAAGIVALDNASDPGLSFLTPRALSGDGSTVVGQAVAWPSIVAFVWNASDGIVRIPDLAGGQFGEPMAVSSDGSVVVGSCNSPIGEQAFVWNATGGTTGLGRLFDFGTSAARGVSADGGVIVGDSSTGSPMDNDWQAFVWDSANGMVGLGGLGGDPVRSRPLAVSANGLTVVGAANSLLGSQAFRWDATHGMVGLGDLAGGIFTSYATAVSADGDTIVGTGESASGPEAFVWRADTGMVGLGRLPGGCIWSYASDVTADGRVVVGHCDAEVGPGGLEPFVWDEVHGMQRLTDLLLDRGVDLTDWSLESAAFVSADGLTIVGYGYGPGGFAGPYIADLPEPSGALGAAVSIAVLGWLRRGWLGRGV